MGKFKSERMKSTEIERRVDYIAVRKIILIVCEGGKTEPNYFKSFKLSVDVELTVKGGAGNTLSVVEKAEEASRKKDYDSIWCVFDRDSFPNGDFTNAIRSAVSKGYKVGYSNEAFEIWYLMHFDYQITAHSRKEYKRLLTMRLKKKYEKNDPSIYDLLLDRQHIAIKNAEKLCNEYAIHNPEVDNPFTTVHLLVKELNSNINISGTD